MSLSKQASPDHPIHELFMKRWSPYAFSDQPISEEDLRALFEAARWSASNFNEQPWRYIVADSEGPRRVRAAALLPGDRYYHEGQSDWNNYRSDRPWIDVHV
jgi:nitroreductase